MIRLKGIGVFDGISIGRAKIRKIKEIEIDERHIREPEVNAELQKFEIAVNAVVHDIDHLIKNFTYSKEDRDILTTHKLIMQDPEFIKNIHYLIANEMYAAEYALHKHFKELIQLFHQMENEYFSQRASDYQDVAYRLLSNLTETDESVLEGLDSSTILVMEEITPTYVSLAVQKEVRGLCLQKGSLTSHSSIIARSLNLITIVGVERLLSVVDDNDVIILDGNTGEAIINPDDAQMEHYRELLMQEEEERQELETYIGKKTITSDGHRILLYNNIEFPDEVEYLLHNQTDGVGLFRTEFLYLSRPKLPTEKEQLEIYKTVASNIYPNPVTIRTIDIGGDKLSNIFNIAKEANPNLGLRGIRLSLRHPNILKTQIRAILKAALFGNLQIMFPMISGIEELRETKQILEECKRELKAEGQPFKGDIPVGIMIEVPAAAVVSDWLGRESDFFSIGTNDLVQYLLAVDRNSENVSEYYDPYHPAVVRTLKTIADNAFKNSIPVGICGEIAGDLDYIAILVGLGLNSFSVSPALSLGVKKKISSLNRQKCVNLVNEVVTYWTADAVKKRVKEINT